MHSFYLKGMFSIDAGFYISVYICSVIIYYAFGSVLLHNQTASERREKWQIGQKGTFQKVLGYGSERHSNLFGPPRSFASHAQKSGHRKLGAFRYHVRREKEERSMACKSQLIVDSPQRWESAQEDQFSSRLPLAVEARRGGLVGVQPRLFFSQPERRLCCFI